MIDFLYKSFLSLIVLLAIYHLILEKQKMHKFNRFYLLFSLIFSLVLPFITIKIATENVATVQQTYRYLIQNSPINNQTDIEQSFDYTSIILWSFYTLITSAFLFRYIRNITKILSSIKSNSVIECQKAKLVLMNEQTPPHTFLNYIFLNKTDYQNRKIEEELYTHELVHVTQKHTLDVLLIETIKTVFWFNPLFIFYKKAIQLNHEFLADESVVNTFNNIPFYQNLLLYHANSNPTSILTSNLNYSITKKRFIMMTKTVSRTKALFYKIALLPMLSGIIFFTCIEGVAQITTTVNQNIKDDKIVSNTVKPTSSPTESTIKNKIKPGEEPEFTINYIYDLKGAKINETTLQNSLTKLSTYIVNSYKSPKEIDKNDEIVIIRFLLKKEGNLTEVKSIHQKETEPDTKLINILKSSPKSIFENINSETDWNDVLIQMMFKPKGIEEIIAKEKGIPGKVAIGFPGLK